MGKLYQSSRQKNYLFILKRINSSGGIMPIMIVKTGPMLFAFSWINGKFKTERVGFSVATCLEKQDILKTGGNIMLQFCFP